MHVVNERNMFNIKHHSPLKVIIPVPNIHQSSIITLQIFCIVCPPLPSSLFSIKIHSRNPGNKNSAVCNIRHVNNDTDATDNAYFSQTVDFQSAMHANRRMSDANST